MVVCQYQKPRRNHLRRMIIAASNATRAAAANPTNTRHTKAVASWDACAGSEAGVSAAGVVWTVRSALASAVTGTDGPASRDEGARAAKAGTAASPGAAAAAAAGAPFSTRRA